MMKETMKRVNFYLPAELLEKVKALSEDKSIKYSMVLRKALERYVDEDGETVSKLAKIGEDIEKVLARIEKLENR